MFIRLSGCNLQCSFCDTKKAWKTGRFMSLDQIREKVLHLRNHHPYWWTCLTGGEPLIQNIQSLVQMLREEGLRIQIETNATLYKELAVDWYTVSPKPESYTVHPSYREKAKEVKLIVTRELNLAAVTEQRNLFPLKTPLLLQAQSNLKWSLKRGQDLLEQATGEGLKNIRLAVQLHKILGLP